MGSPESKDPEEDVSGSLLNKQAVEKDIPQWEPDGSHFGPVKGRSPACIEEETSYLDEDKDQCNIWPGRIYRNKPLIEKFWT